MFHVLVNRHRARLAEPRTVAWIAAIHGVIALVAWIAYTRATAEEPPRDPPEYVVEFPILSDPAVVVSKDPAPARIPGTRELPAPAEAPDRISPPNPNDRALNPNEYNGMGPIARVEVPPLRPVVTPSLPSRRLYPNFNTGVIPAEMAEEQPVMADPAEAGRLLQRHYPVALAAERVSGRTLVEIVVEASGRVRPGSARIVDTSHEPFGQATLRIIERLRFRPARVGNQPVAVAVKVPIVWQVTE
jgi:periplasmic protein TonB